MAAARPFRVLTAVVLCLILFLSYSLLFGSRAPGTTFSQGPFPRDPNLDETGEPAGHLSRVRGNNYAADNPDSDRINAAIISLVRNKELDDILQSMGDLERTWNRKFNYPWMFFNDEPFSDEFQEKTRAATNAEVTFHMVPSEHWDIPSWINKDVMKESADLLEEKKVQYAHLASYHQMCRWNSGFFYKHPALQNIKWYWRVEPKVHFFCDVDYDVFRYLQDNNKTYGYTINLYDSPPSIESLWPETIKFIADNSRHLAKPNMMEWLTDAEHRPDHNLDANGYSTCHFWSNFEIADMDFWRSAPYEAYFEHLDRAGGFFYERWGDAPVHSIGLGMFLNPDQIHWFKDIGYQHIPFFNCPNSPKCRGCVKGRLTDGEVFLNKEDCRPVFHKYYGNEWEPKKKKAAIAPQPPI